MGNASKAAHVAVARGLRLASDIIYIYIYMHSRPEIGAREARGPGRGSADAALAS